jgi:cell volume regulation protein A
MLDAINLGILIGAGLIAASVMSSLVSSRVGAPLLLVFLAVGLLAGVDGLGGIHFRDAQAAYFIGSLALAVILFESGFETPFQSFKVAAWPALTLATLGVLFTTVIVGFVATYLLPFSRIEGLLMGAIVSSTDAAAVFFLMRAGGITIRGRVRSTLEIESGSNDPMAILLTLLLAQIAAGTIGVTHPVLEIAQLLIQQLGLGLLMGALGGWGIVELVNRLKLDAGLYPIVVMSLVLILFALTGLMGGSGFLAVYIAGIGVGNLNLRAANAVRKFQSGLTWLCQIVMFLTLGLLATPSHFEAVVEAALGLAAVLIFVARPLAVGLTLLPFGFSRDETGFVAWLGLRGAVSILLAIVPILYGLPHASIFFNVAFIVVLTSLLVQGWTIGPVARWLGMIVPPRLGPVERVQLDLPGNAEHELVVYRITPESPVARGARLPRWARPSLILRQNKALTLATAGRLVAGDYVYLFTEPKQVRLLDKLFASPSAIDDREFFGDFSMEPQARLADLGIMYGFPVQPAQQSFTIDALFHKEFGGRYEVGDRLAVGSVELVLRNLDEKNRITEVGLVLEPTGLAEEKLKLRPTLRRLAKKIISLFRRPRN